MERQTQEVAETANPATQYNPITEDRTLTASELYKKVIKANDACEDREGSEIGQEEYNRLEQSFEDTVKEYNQYWIFLENRLESLGKQNPQTEESKQEIFEITMIKTLFGLEDLLHDINSTRK